MHWPRGQTVKGQGQGHKSSVKLRVQRQSALIGREESRDHARWAVIGPR